MWRALLQNAVAGEYGTKAGRGRPPPAPKISSSPARGHALRARYRSTRSTRAGAATRHARATLHARCTCPHTLSTRRRTLHPYSTFWAVFLRPHRPTIPAQLELCGVRLLSRSLGLRLRQKGKPALLPHTETPSASRPDQPSGYRQRAALFPAEQPSRNPSLSLTPRASAVAPHTHRVRVKNKTRNDKFASRPIASPSLGPSPQV